MARDRQAPRSFVHIGDRLTFRNGIVLLSVTAATVYVGFRGITETLLPLYAVGVFLAFTLSQTGMIMHWRRHRDQPHWRPSLVFNGAGAVMSGIVFVIEGITKFTESAWVSIILISGIIAMALRTHRYYELAGQQLALRRPEDATAPATVTDWITARERPDGRQGEGTEASEAIGESRGGSAPRADRLAHHRPGCRHGPGRHAGTGMRRSTQPARIRAACQPDDGGGRPVHQLLAGMGRPPAPRSHRLPRTVLWWHRWSTTS